MVSFNFFNCLGAWFCLIISDTFEIEIVTTFKTLASPKPVKAFKKYHLQCSQQWKPHYPLKYKTHPGRAGCRKNGYK